MLAQGLHRRIFSGCIQREHMSNSSNYRPHIGWIYGAQMVALNMQGHEKSLWFMQGMFRAYEAPVRLRLLYRCPVCTGNGNEYGSPENVPKALFFFGHVLKRSETSQNGEKCVNGR